jgi:hypothetical protein
MTTGRLSRAIGLLSLASLALILACKPATQGDAAAPDTGGTTADERTGPTFENPGGMWMPSQLATGDHAKILKDLGLAYEPAALTDPTQFPLGAIVSLGFCSGSFVSPDGLIATNHHCAVPVALQYNSTPEKNLLQDGYLAKTRADELWAGPQQRIYVTTGFTDVTSNVLTGTDSITDDKARFEKIAENRKSLQSTCEVQNPNTRCTIASYYEGAQYFEIRQLELKDIRLVYAPDAGVGVFGGETDNWRWPRHTGDFTFLRAYVGKDGKPAEYSTENVPYKPPHYLKPASQPLEEGDLVMVAGYPGRTNRLKTADEARDAASFFYPYSIKRMEETVAVLEALAKSDPELAIKVNRTLRGQANYLTNNRGILDGLVKGGLADKKAGEEAKFVEWINADESRKAKYGDVIDAIAAINAKTRETRETDLALGEILRASTILQRAIMVRDAAEARANKKPAGNAKSTKDQLDVAQKAFDVRADRALLRLALVRTARLPAEKRPKAYTAIVGDASDEAAIDKALDKLYASTKLGEVEGTMTAWEKGKSAALRKGKDGFIKLAYAIEAESKDLEVREKTAAGAMAAVRPRYIAALREWKGADNVAADANSTLRVTYGTVRGYAPAPGKPVYRPFTTISEMVAKHTGEGEFDAPDDVLAAIEAKKFGPYVDSKVGEVPLDFLADLDITGGNSGSACINERGEIVGLAFDGNYEAMASDWLFMPEVTRSIQVDIRYAYWLMDAVDGADHLLQEMGVTPKID